MLIFLSISVWYLLVGRIGLKLSGREPTLPFLSLPTSFSIREGEEKSIVLMLEGNGW